MNDVPRSQPPDPTRPAASARPASLARSASAGALRQALTRLADALDQPGEGEDDAHGAAYAAVLNLVGDRFLDADADFVANVASQLAGNARLFGAWVHFMDHFAGYVLQGGDPSCTRYVYALAGVLRGVPAHHHVGRVESTEAIAQSLSQALFGRDGGVRVAADLRPTESVEPDFFGFLQFYAVRHATDEPAEDDNFSASPEEDARWAALDEQARAGEAAGREVVLAVCVRLPGSADQDEAEHDYAKLLRRLRRWADERAEVFALDYRIGDATYPVGLEVLAAGEPFTTALQARHQLSRQQVEALVAQARRAAPEAALRAVVSLVAPPDELAESADAPLARPSVALFDADSGLCVAGAHLGATADLSEQLGAIEHALADQGVAAVRVRPAVRAEAAQGDRPVFYDEDGTPHRS